MRNAEAEPYLRGLFEGCSGLVSLSWWNTADDQRGGRAPQSFFGSLDSAVHRAGLMNGEVHATYVRMTTVADRPTGRGGEADAHELVALFADVDYGDEGHEGDPPGGLRRPADADEALSLVDEAGLPAPTLVVNSGGGLYPMWALVEPWVLDDDTRPLAKSLNSRWNQHLAHVAARLGLHHGAGVSDLARILRLPGSTNHKTAQDRLCRVVSSDGPRYTVDQLHAALAAAVADEALLHGTSSPVEPTSRSSYSTEEREQFDFREAVEPRVEDRLKNGPGIRGVLLSAGWGECDCSRTDCLEHFTRPGDPASHHSAHTLPENPFVLVVHSAATGLPDGGGHRLTASRLYAHLYHDGDETAAHRALTEMERGDGGVLAPYGWGSATLIDSLFDSTPTLRHIRTAAHSRRLDATAPLLNVLGIRACTIPVERCIPALVGSRRPVNLLLGTVGVSGGGKTTALDLACELMGLDDEAASAFMESMGSAQGIAEKYMGVGVNDEGKKVRQAVHGRARFFSEDEIDAIAAKGEAASDAALSELRKAYSGAMLGQANATADRDRKIPPRSYRFVFQVNVQPGRSQSLFTDAQIRAGTPQRFVMMPAVVTSKAEWRARREAGLIPQWPGPLDLPVTEFERSDFEVSDAEILAEIDDVFFDSRESEAGSMMAHRQLTKLKIAAVLADLHGESVINQGWWGLAEIVMGISDGQVDLCRTAIAEVAAEENRRIGTALGHQQFEIAKTREELEGEEFDALRRRVLERIDGGRETTRRELALGLSNRRQKVLTSVLDGMVDDGVIDVVREDTGGRPKMVYRRVAP